MKKLKERLRRGDTLVGCLLNLGSALTAEMAGRAGFDCVVIDLEHGAGGEADVLPQLHALEATASAARRHDKALGVLMAKVEEFERYHFLGFRLIACGSDGSTLNTAARRQVEMLSTARSRCLAG